MKKLLTTFVVVLLLLISPNGIAQNLSSEQNAFVANLIEQLDKEDWAGLGESIAYPLKRQYPLPLVADKNEFLTRRYELFDTKLIEMISSSLTDSTWTPVGSRGMMLNNGDIWLDNDGKIVAINYQTEPEKERESELIEADRDSLPVFLQVYERPVLKMDAGKWIIRIDQVKGQSYRFVGWIQGNRNPNRDAVEIIPNGFLQHQGSGGNHTYTFTSDIGKFVCFVNQTREEGTPEGELVIYRDGQLIRSYPSVWMEY